MTLIPNGTALIYKLSITDAQTLIIKRNKLQEEAKNAYESKRKGLSLVTDDK